MFETPRDTDATQIDLRSLITNSRALAATLTVEQARRSFADLSVDFLAVLDGPRLVGVCARRELDDALGSRYGFALNAQRPVREHLMAAPLVVTTETPLTEVFKAAAAREDRTFYDDVLVIEGAGAYVGLIAMRTLTRLQTGILLGNIDRLEASRREIAEKNREMESDLAMAREVQLALLPETTTTLAAGGFTLEIAHRYRPAGGVSGDFFDILRLSENEIGILVCDVMGHGVRSALITAMIRAMLEELRPIATEPGQLLTRLNRDLSRILRQTGGLIFVTAAYGVMSLHDGKLRYAQAGHPTPLRWDASAHRVAAVTSPPDTAGPALGLITDFEFGTSEEPFLAGDRLVFFTDGLFEAANGAGEEFGPARLATVVAQGASQSADTAVGTLLAEVSAFCQGAPFADDICVVVATLRQP